ncbi:MAG: hypothetical protein ACTHN5_05200 [Phycisphaerae bacterium]
MLRSFCALAAALAITGLAGFAHASTVLPGDASVRYAVNAGGFFVNATGESQYPGDPFADSNLGSNNWIIDAGAYGTAYSDAGIVLGIDGSLSLGQLQSVDVHLVSGAGQTTPTINLWLDTGNDGNFFAFSGDQFTGLNGDSYYGADAPGNINTTTTFSFLGGLGSGSHSLADLQSGSVAGIDGNTKVALWIGITGATNFNSNYAVISSVDVASAPAVPLPASAWSGLSLLAGLGLFTGAKRLRTRLA